MWKLIIPLSLAVGLAAPADAKKARRSNKATRPAATQKAGKEIDRADLPPKSNAATEFEKAKAELDDLKTTRELPVTTLDNQESDREDPLKKK